MMFDSAATPGIVEQAIRQADPDVGRALDRVLADGEPTPADARALAGASGKELSAMVLAADYLRKRVNGDVVTYVVNQNINFTNICSIGCDFCAFSTLPASPDGWRYDLAEIGEKTREARAKGATEVCIQGGINPKDDKFLYRDILRAVKQAVPDMHVHAFSPLEILTGARKTRMSFRDYLAMLKAEGLDSIPGTAAEILVDEVRRQIAPNKLPRDTWVEIIKTAHSLGIPSSATIMYGHVEQPEHVAEHMMLLREIQKESGGFTEFVPLGFIHQNTELFRSGGARPGSTLVEDLRAIALGRLLLNGLVDHVQASWVKLGHKLALVGLMAGADDYGGTLMEESISRLAGASHGEVTLPDELRRLIRSVGRLPAQRNTTYSVITRDEPTEPGTEPDQGLVLSAMNRMV